MNESNHTLGIGAKVWR